MTRDPGSLAAQRVLDMQARGVSQQERRGCTEKVTYLTRKAARAAARQLIPRHGKKLSVYKCPHCELFHLTKPENHYRKRGAG